MKAVGFFAKRGRFRVDAKVQPIGDDLLVAMWGGTRPHIGAVGIAQPRPSLANLGRWSATSSNFTFLGHKEDLLVKEISETLAAGLRKNVVVTAGIHWDDLGPRDLVTIEGLSRTLAKKILATKPRTRKGP